MAVLQFASLSISISVRVHLWDFSGNNDYLDVRNELYGDVDAAFIVFDVTNMASFENLESWVRELKRYDNSNPEVTVVANKVSHSNATHSQCTYHSNATHSQCTYHSNATHSQCTYHSNATHSQCIYHSNKQTQMAGE